MVSVTNRVRTVKQPCGGYIRVKDMQKIKYQDNDQLTNLDDKLVSPNIIGLAVDYLTRMSLGYKKEDVFRISLMGAILIKEPNMAQDLLEEINGLDRESIISTCKLVGFDSVYRAGIVAYKPVHLINPSDETIEDIRKLVHRSVTFFKNNGPVLTSGFSFEGGYSSSVNTGDADFLTLDCLWDLKVSRNTISSKNTLQILMYYIMGLKSKHQNHFDKLEKIGIFNPRLNTAYFIDVKEISDETFREVACEVIGY